MIDISVKVKYALAIVFELSSSKDNSLTSIKTLSDTCNVPKKYLEQILLNLRRSTIVKSTRGSQGGYALASPPEKISVLTIKESLEGKKDLTEGYCGNDTLKQYWKSVDSLLETRFNMTIADLLKEKEKYEKYLTYTI